MRARPARTLTPIAVVVQQHVEEAANLRNVRSVQVRAPHVRLLHLARLDERIAAHLDGIAEAGEQGAARCAQALDPPGAGTTFAATVQAIEMHDQARLQKLLALSDALPDSRRGLLSAFGWVSAASLRGLTKPLLEANAPWWREVGIAACAMHRVDPGIAAIQEALDAPAAAALTACALKAVVQLARVELLDACLARAQATSLPALAVAAASAAALLGDRGRSLDTLGALAISPGPERLAVLLLWLKLARGDDVHATLRALHADPSALRTLICAIGIAGDPHHVPWLLARMDDLALSRLAGESFSLITGLDLALLDLDRKPPEGVEIGPNGDPEDPNVALDGDDGLPWPDAAKLAAWWKANGASFTPGARYFLGQAPTAAHCLSVLQTGFQRQRRHAAEYLCLLKPGTPLFNIAAPAWRQQRLLAQMTGP